MAASPAPEEYLAVGLLSGTSVDGIDASLARYRLGSDGAVSAELLASLVSPLPEKVRSEIFRLFEDGPGALEALALLDMELGELFAEAALAVMKAGGVRPVELRAIGSHGQTIRHIAGAPDAPGRASLQIGSGAVIARRTGVPTACDFRSSDIAAGGTGAPLVPFFDLALAQGLARPVAFQNYGGIGNVCWIGRDDELIAFDTGPGNALADLLAEELSGGVRRYDRDGELGLRGSPREELIRRWLGHPYFELTPPKSCGREQFGRGFYDRELAPLAALGRDGGLPAAADAPSPAELMCSVEAFTARSTARAYRDFLPEQPALVIVSGGGARNPVVMAELAAALPEARVAPAEDFGLSSDYMEAMAFGLFGLLRALGRPNTEPRATGARVAACAGALYLP
jgi:anhydro-N-acetylmuramic acid kinase